MILAHFKGRKARIDDAASRMLRISGEIVTVDDAAARVGINRHALLKRYREGRKTWDDLRTKPR